MQNKSFVIPGLVILTLILLLPFWYNNTSALGDDFRPQLEKAEVTIDPETGEKIKGPDDLFIDDNETLEIWRSRHMEYLTCLAHRQSILGGFLYGLFTLSIR